MIISFLRQFFLRPKHNFKETKGDLLKALNCLTRSQRLHYQINGVFSLGNDCYRQCLSTTAPTLLLRRSAYTSCCLLHTQVHFCIKAQQATGEKTHWRRRNIFWRAVHSCASVQQLSHLTRLKCTWSTHAPHSRNISLFTHGAFKSNIHSFSSINS